MLIRAVLLLCSSILPFICLAQQKGTIRKKEKQIVVFTVAGNPVSADEFIYLYNKNHPNKSEDFTKAKVDEYLSLFVNFKLKVQEAERRGMDTVPAFISEFNTYRDELRKPYLPDVKLVDSLVRLTYDRMKYEVKASHILVSLKPDALPQDTLAAYSKITDIRSKLLSGMDFSAAAVQYSDDPSAKTNQGSLGYFTAMQMVYPFENAAYRTAPGEVSMPIRTRFGYHLIKVYDKRPSQGEVEVSHIMIRTGGELDSSKAKNTIFTLYDQLQAGVSWDELCGKYSEDPATKANGGRLRPIGTGAMSAVPEFENAAFGLERPGDISDPVQTQYGWHIIRLEKKIPLASFETVEPSLKNKVLRDERTAQSKQVLENRLRREYQLKEDNTLKREVLALADSTLQMGAWKIPTFPKGIDVLFSLRDRNFTAGEFLTYAQKSQKRNALTPANYILQLYNNFIDSNIQQLVEEKIIASNPSFSFLLKEYYEGILLFEIMEMEVWNRASEDSTGQQQYYASHLSKYTAGERAQAVLYTAGNADFRPDLEQLIRSGNTNAIPAFVTANKVKVESGFYQRHERPVFEKIPWAVGVYSTENNGIYYLAWLKDILPPGAMSFQESRSAIITDYQAFLEEKWIKRLKEKYTVKVNEKGKKYILHALLPN